MKLVTFTSTSADPDGTIAAYAWDLDNDGTFDDGVGPTAQRSFPNGSTYTVRLRVTDGNGAADIVKPSVEPPAPWRLVPAGRSRHRSARHVHVDLERSGRIDRKLHMGPRQRWRVR